MQERPANAVSRPVSASQAPEVHPDTTPVQDDWRAALAEALRAKTPLTGWQRDLRTYALSPGQAHDLADALLPTVRRIVEQRAAEGVRAAAMSLRTEGEFRAADRCDAVAAAIEAYR